MFLTSPFRICRLVLICLLGLCGVSVLRDVEEEAETGPESALMGTWVNWDVTMLFCKMKLAMYL